MKLPVCSSNETEKDYWDLKEDLDECIEDIEFYKKKWKDYEDYETIKPDADKDEIEANRLYTTTTTNGKQPKQRRKHWKSRSPRQTTSRSSSSTLS